MKRAYEHLINDVGSRRRSQFQSNVWRALRSLLGNSICVQGECLSLSGYSYDFQILFDKRGNPLPVPRKWKTRSEISVKGSVGIKTETECKHNTKFEIDDLVDALKEGKSSVELHPTQVIDETNYINRRNINLALDWGSKFEYEPQNIANTVMIEANGDYHYAKNSSHPLGYTCLKKRQTNLLGWALVTVRNR